MLPTPRSGRWACLVLAASSFAALTTVAPARAEVLDLTLSDALRLARERSVTLSLASADLASARGLAREAELPARDSSLGLSGGPRLGDRDHLDLELEWSRDFEPRGARAARRTVADAQVQVSETRSRELELELLARVAEVHALALHADLRLAAADEGLALAQRLGEAARIRREVGESGRLEENLALAAQGRSAAVVARARADRERLHGRLRALLGLSPETALEVVGDLAALAAGAADDAARVGDAPSVATLKAREEGAAAAVEFARASGRSARSFRAGVGREENSTLVFAGVAWTLPVPGRGRGLVDAALAQREALSLAGDLEKRRVDALASAEREATRRLLDGLEQQRRLGLAPLEEAGRLIGEAFELGALPLTEVLAAARELAAARSEQLDLLRDAALAALHARVLAGLEPLS